jgi:acetylglutamate kinase
MSKAPKIDPQTQARILSEALPHMQRYDEEIVVVKYGGHAMGQEQTARDFAKDIVLLEQTAINPVVVHGGGPQIEAMLKKLGIKSEFAAGLRITDAKTVEIVEMVWPARSTSNRRRINAAAVRYRLWQGRQHGTGAQGRPHSGRSGFQH